MEKSIIVNCCFTCYWALKKNKNTIETILCNKKHQKCHPLTKCGFYQKDYDVIKYIEQKE